MDTKKHVNQMTDEEKELLLVKLRNHTPKFTSYSKRRMYERGIQEWQVKRALANGELIEYHHKSMTQQRILVRGRENVRGNSACVVLDIFTGEVVTAYFNKVTDKHIHLNTREYDSKLDVLSLVTIGEFKI